MTSSYPIIQNVVSTVSLALTGREKFNLNSIAEKLAYAEYRPERFSALVIRINPSIKATALFFATGRLVCVGTKSERESQIFLENFVQIISAVNGQGEIQLKEAFKIQNMTASYAFAGRLNLEGILN
jgi:transcription initiation factor TFIID TATA-box-binding protein